MARCEDCLHYDICLNTEAHHLRMILSGNKADEKCRFFKSTADVAPKSEVEKLHEVIFKKEDLMQQIAKERNEYADEVTRLTDDNEYLQDKVFKVRLEIAREIFEEIEEGIKAAFAALQFERNPVHRKVKNETYSSLMRFVMTVEKKYTEGNNGVD